MSTAGSGRSGEAPAARDAGAGSFAPPAAEPVAPEATPPRRRRTRIVRWEGLLPIALLLVLFAIGYLLFGEPVARQTLAQAATQALGTQVDVRSLDLREREISVELRGLAIADPADPMRNFLEAGRVLVELEPEPLLEKKIVVRRLVLGDVRANTRRTVRATPAAPNGYAARTLRSVRAWAKQFDVPPLSLTPIDTIRSIVLDPHQLQTVQSALALAARADSSRRAVQEGYESLRLRETLDSTRALYERLSGTDVRTLGLAGARQAVSDVRLAIARVDSAKRRVETLARTTRGGIERLQQDVRSLDSTRRADYAFARSLLKLPTFEAPELGEAMFGAVSIGQFEQALYYAALARQYAPPGLLPREQPGPKRLRKSGSTVRFVAQRQWPRFHVQRADLSLAVPDGLLRGSYRVAATDITTEPAIVGKPTAFAMRRDATGSDIEQLRVTALLDQRGGVPRTTLGVAAAGVRVPGFPLPLLPLRAEPGRGTSELRLSLDGDRVAGTWKLTSGRVEWPTDSARSRRLNYIEALVARVVTGVSSLDLDAEVSGTLADPRLRVRSSLDRQIADRLREVIGDEVRRAEVLVRAKVDSIVEERTTPVRARVEELRNETQQRIDDAEARLEEERQRLEARLKTLTAGLVSLPNVPNVPGLPQVPRIPGVSRPPRDSSARDTTMLPASSTSPAPAPVPTTGSTPPA